VNGYLFKGASVLPASWHVGCPPLLSPPGRSSRTGNGTIVSASGFEGTRRLALAPSCDARPRCFTWARRSGILGGSTVGIRLEWQGWAGP